MRVPEAVKVVVRPMLGLAAPALRAFVRRVPQSSAKRVAWRYLGQYLAFGAWSYDEPTAHGFRIAANTADMIARYIYYFGVWEPSITRWIEETLRPGDAFIDVGANLGYYALLASKIVGPNGAVVAIEASQANFVRLRQNLALNVATNVRAVNVAAWNVESTVEIFSASRGNLGMTSIFPLRGSVSEGRIAARPLPAIVSEREWARARIVKIDVEGSEYAVVAGFADALATLRHDVEIVVEISPTRLAVIGKVPNDIIEIFTRAGFSAFAIANDYRMDAYLAPFTYVRPQPVRAEIRHDTDIIFSRSDAERRP